MHRLPRTLVTLVSLAALATAPAGARDGDPITGAALYARDAGPVTMQLLSEDMPGSVNWFLPLFWKTGPGALDYASTGGQVPTCAGATCALSRVVLSGQFGRHNHVPGAVIASPPLARGTPVFVAAAMFSDMASASASEHARLRDLVQTGGTPAALVFLREPATRPLLTHPPRPAAILTVFDGAVILGFPGPEPAGPAPDARDYPIRILVGNVDVR